MISRAHKTAGGYLEAMQDCLEIVDAQIGKSLTSEIRLQLTILRSEIQCLHPGVRADREQSLINKLEAVIDDFANRIVEAAQYDITEAASRKETRGHVCANVRFGFPLTVKWLRYAASRGNEHARQLIDYIGGQRSPSSPQDVRKSEAAVHRMLIDEGPPSG